MANVNVLSEISFRQVEHILATVSSDTLRAHFANIAQELINDVNDDDDITYKDLVMFNPLKTNDKSSLNFGYTSFLQNIRQQGSLINAIHTNQGSDTIRGFIRDLFLDDLVLIEVISTRTIAIIASIPTNTLNIFAIDTNQIEINSFTNASTNTN